MSVNNFNALDNALLNKRLVCYGAGVNAQLMLMNEKFKPYLSKILYFVDADKSKHGKTISGNDEKEYSVFPIEKLEKEENIVVMVTISDYLLVGNMLERKEIEWFSWSVISADVDLKTMFMDKENENTSFFLMNTPDYLNLGDHAIAFAEDVYIKKNFGKYYEFGSNLCSEQLIAELKKYIIKKDLIFFNGGGNLGSLWRTNEEVLRRLLREFPDNMIVVFPQSIYYGDSQEEKEYFLKSKKIYNAHKNLLICVRDRRSYEFVTSSYTCKCMLLPDMVLTLKHRTANKRKGIGVLLRHDKEQLLDNGYEKEVDRLIAELGEEKVIIDHYPVINISNNRQDVIKNLMQKYLECRLVITDRLHGMILSAVTNTPCIAFDNSYHKVSDLYNTWLQDLSYINVTEPLYGQELVQTAVGLISEKNKSYDNVLFEKKFDLLTYNIKNIFNL